MIEMHAFYVFLSIASVLLAVFIYVALSTRRARDVDYHAAYALRKKLFFVLLVVLGLAMGMTLGKTPYPKGNELPDKVVFVVGKQFSFALSDTPITNDQEYEAGTYSAPVQVSAGSLVEFRVTSFDVNHSFAVYSPDDRLIAQTQAMPGYVNRLRVRFQETGRYYVLCLELCGMGHHRMRGVFDVK
jgi:cytochrome c oxidase subunit II